jgi:hypothetical protein
MSTRQQESPLSQATTAAITETLIGSKNYNMQSGDWIKTKARIFSGPTNRLLDLFDHLQLIGCNGDQINKMRNMICESTIGLSPELPPNGMRGEALAVITLQNLPKKEQVMNTKSGIIRRGIPEPEQSQPVGAPIE